MSIQTTFGGAILTGEDAAKFRRQITYGRPSKAARASVERGIKLARQLAVAGSLGLDLRDGGSGFIGDGGTSC